MVEIVESWELIQDFLDRGGDVLYMIMGVLFLMWTLIIERTWYFRTGHKEQAEEVLAAWEARPERQSWYAHKVRLQLISEVQENLNRSLPLIKTLVALCPLLGLLGTVTGMIEVFDIMAITGSSNARAMAAGVSKATLPTMAGMVAALSGLYFSVRLQRIADAQTHIVGDSLTMEH